jgi:site-specific DNA-methyltransferase (adenine-specific)
MTTSKAAGNTAMASGNRLINGDCLEVMRGIPDGSIDAVITDPPYHSTHLKFDQAPRVDYGAWLEDCRRVLKPSGVLVSFCDLNLLIELRRHKAFKTAYELIWEKTAAVGFLDANRRPLRSHEYMLVMVDGLNKATYNPQKTAGTPVKRVPRTRGISRVYSAHNDGGQYINPTGASRVGWVRR